LITSGAPTNRGAKLKPNSYSDALPELGIVLRERNGYLYDQDSIKFDIALA